MSKTVSTKVENGIFLFGIRKIHWESSSTLMRSNEKHAQRNWIVPHMVYSSRRANSGFY